MNFLQYGNCIN